MRNDETHLTRLTERLSFGSSRFLLVVGFFKRRIQNRFQRLARGVARCLERGNDAAELLWSGVARSNFTAQNRQGRELGRASFRTRLGKRGARDRDAAWGACVLLRSDGESSVFGEEC